MSKIFWMLGWCLIVGMAASASAAEWPQFRGLNRDGKSQETGLLNQWPEGGPKLIWSASEIGEGFSSAAISQEMIYTTGLVGEEGLVSCFDLNGKLLWKKVYGKEWSAAGSHPGVRTTVTVDDDKIYLISAYGKVVCFNGKTGELVWSVDTLERFNGRNVRWGIAESPLVYNDKVICTPGGKDAGLVALDKQTGKTVWVTKGLDEASAYCSPMLANHGGKNVIFTVLAKSIVAVNADTGELLWRAPHETSYDISAVSPVYHEGRLYVTNGYGKGGMMFEVAADNSGVKELWADKTLDCHHGGVVLRDGFIYGIAMKGGLVCLDWSNGQAKYCDKEVKKGSTIYADGRLYCYEEKNGALRLIKAEPQGDELVGMLNITSGSGMHWAHPSISNGRLYVRHGDVLMAFDISGK